MDARLSVDGEICQNKNTCELAKFFHNIDLLQNRHLSSYICRVFIRHYTKTTADNAEHYKTEMNVCTFSANNVFLHGFDDNIGYGHWNTFGHKIAGDLIRELLNRCLQPQIMQQLPTKTLIFKLSTFALLQSVSQFAPALNRPRHVLLAPAVFRAD